MIRASDSTGGPLLIRMTAGLSEPLHLLTDEAAEILLADLTCVLAARRAGSEREALSRHIADRLPDIERTDDHG